METSDKIIDGLYIGGVMAAVNDRDLQANNITHILSVDEKPLPDILTNRFTYKHVFALDLYDFDLLGLLPECIIFIDQARENDGVVLVHCQAGVSRSATVVIAYLMHKLQIAKEKAMEMVAAVRQFVRPNEGFREQLQLFENMGSKLDKTHSEFRAYQLSKLAVRFKCGQFAQGLSDTEIPEEVFVQPDYSAKDNEAHYKCRKCRMFLFHNGALTSHNIGEGESAFDWRSKVPANKRPLNSPKPDDTICHRSLFVDPLAWMKGKIHMVQGKLNCPKCDIKIGSYVWYGEKCPCGAWVAPAFHIDSGKVDKIPTQPVMPRTHVPASLDTAAATASTEPPPHQLGAVSAFPSTAGASSRPLSQARLPERTTAAAAAARLSTMHPVAAVQPRMASTSAVSSVTSTAPPSSDATMATVAPIQSMDIEMGGGEPGTGEREAETGESGAVLDNTELESGINSIHMDVDSG